MILLDKSVFIELIVEVFFSFLRFKTGIAPDFKRGLFKHILNREISKFLTTDLKV